MSTLRLILANLIQHALLNPGQPAMTKLKGGLVICFIHLSKTNNFILELHRATTYPSTIEWYTVLNHLPFLSHVTPTRIMIAGTFALRAAIPIQDHLL